ncbi:MAG: alpha/beta hydrolase [Planctomycetota bacterium]|jgi:hypothetical protein
MTARERSRTWRLRILALVPAAVLLFAEAFAGAPAPDSRVVAGKSFVLEFPAFGKTWCGQEAGKMQVHIPSDYTPERKFAMFAWFGGGKGTYTAGMPRKLTGGKGFVCVGLPYRLPDPAAKNDTGWATGWKHYKPMLDALEKAVPNIHSGKRAVGGFSSGGAAVATLINRSEEFVAYFHAFTLAGYGQWVRRRDRLKGRPVLLHCGENDTRNKGNISSFPAFKSIGADVEMIVYKGYGHGTPAEYHPKIQNWLELKVVYAGLAEAAAAMDRSVKAGAWTTALKHAREVLDIAGAGRPEGTAAQETMKKAAAKGDESLAKLLGGKPAAAALRKFADEWQGCACADRAREEADKLGRKELERISAMSGWQRTDKLRRFLQEWKGYPVEEKAVAAYEPDAAKALAALKAGRPTVRALKDFVKKWSPAPSAAKAAEMLEELAGKELESVLASKGESIRKSRLQSFVRAYPDTKAAARAKEELAAMREKEAAGVLARIAKQPPAARKGTLKSFLQAYGDTKAADDARKMLTELK